MKNIRSVFAALAAVVLFAGAAVAGDPTGTWTWSRPGRDGQAMESTMKLELKDGQLTGTVSGFRGGENAISEATFKDDQIAFKVNVEFNGNKRTMTYEGKLAGDTITGTIVFPGRDGGEPRKVDWNATRKKS